MADRGERLPEVVVNGVGAVHELGDRQADPARLNGLVCNWNECKCRLFSEFNVRTAVEHLRRLGWLNAHQALR